MTKDTEENRGTNSVGAVKSCTGWRIQRKRNQMMMILRSLVKKINIVTKLFDSNQKKTKTKKSPSIYNFFALKLKKNKQTKQKPLWLTEILLEFLI